MLTIWYVYGNDDDDDDKDSGTHYDVNNFSRTWQISNLCRRHWILDP